MSGLGTHQPLYTSSIDPELNLGGKRYEAAASHSCPPAHVLESHFSSVDESSLPRFNPLNKARPQSSVLLDVNDSMAMHLLVTTAIVDSRDYEVLSFQEVEDLKKEFDFLGNRIDASKRKLALESKVRDAALSLSRLYSKKGHRQRRSLLGGQQSPNDLTKHTDEELMSSNRKCEELSQELWRLNNRAMEIQKRLLQHAAGVLGMTHQKAASPSAPLVAPYSPTSNYTYAQNKGVMSPLTEEFDDRSFYRTADKLGHFGDPPNTNGAQARESAIDDILVAQRLEDTNNELREFITAYAQDRDLPTPPFLVDGATDGTSTEEQLALLDQNIGYIRQNLPAAAPPSPDPTLLRAADELAETERRLADLWDVIVAGEEDARQQKAKRRQTNNDGAGESDDEDFYDGYSNFTVAAFLDKVAAVHGRAMKLQEEKAILKRQVLQQRRRFEEQFGEVEDSKRAEVDEVTQELQNMENQVTQLSSLLEQREDDIIQSNNKMQRSLEELRAAQEQLQHAQGELEKKKEEMAVIMTELEVERNTNRQREQEIGTGDQTHAAALEAEQHARIEAEEIFAAQIRQKETELEDLQREFEDTKEDRDIAKAELTALSEETDSKFQLLEEELAALTANNKKLMGESKNAVSPELEQSLRNELQEKETQIKKMDEEIQELSAKVAELSMEVVMAKAELDSVSGSRQQRAAETAEARAAAAALAAASKQPQSIDPGLLQEIEDLSKKNQDLIDEIVMLKNERAASANNEHLEKRCKDLQKELTSMLADFENLTKQSIEAEQERSKLEATIDQLRERCEEQETSLAEEKIRLLAAPGRGSVADIRSPSGRHGGESTSTNVLKMEFKKMMRDMRAEQQKALRAEQEERRKLETIVRGMKKEQLMARRAGAGTPTSVASSSA